MVSEHVKSYLCFVLILNENSCYYDLSKLFKQWLLEVIQRVGVILLENVIIGSHSGAVFECFSGAVKAPLETPLGVHFGAATSAISGAIPAPFRHHMQNH